jgi:hypothetical protein
MYKPIKFTITTIQILFCLFLMGCSNDIFGPAKKNPRIGEENISVITGTTDGMKFSDFNKSSQSGDSMPVNALLWRAALDIASLVPLDDVDTFGGSIVTEWYQAANTTDQRLKLTIFVLGLELRSDAIKVQAYTQKKLSNDWVDSGRDEALALRLEELILTRARELRAASVSEITQ